MENLFSRFWKTQFEKNKNKVGYQSLEDLETKLKLFTKMVFPFEMNGDIGGSQWAVGFVDSDVLLPKDICWTPNQKLNGNLLLLLVLKSVAIKALGFKYKFNDRERIAPRIYILSKMPIINSWLDQQFPQFFEFEKQSYLQLEAYLPRNGDTILEYWKRQISSRSMAWDLKSESKLKIPMDQQKRNDSTPFFLHACVPLPYRELNIAGSGSNALAHYLAASKRPEPHRREQSLRHAEGYAPDFLPAIIDFAATLQAEGETRRARKWLDRAAWEKAPSLPLIDPILATIAEQSPRAQQRLLRPFLKGEPGVAHHLLVAEQAVMVEEWERAKQAVEAALALEESKAACSLMAEIEKELRGVDAAHAWLGRALEAPAGESWVCDHCGAQHRAIMLESMTVPTLMSH